MPISPLTTETRVAVHLYLTNSKNIGQRNKLYLKIQLYS